MTKKLTTALVVAFAIFFVMQSPVEAATLLRSSWDATVRLLSSAANAFSTFLRSF